METHNMNDHVRVELTNYGSRILYEYHASAGVEFDENKTTYSCELWMLMHIFGRYTYMGNKQTFVKNRIEIYPSDINVSNVLPTNSASKD